MSEPPTVTEARLVAPWIWAELVPEPPRTSPPIFTLPTATPRMAPDVAANFHRADAIGAADEARLTVRTSDKGAVDDTGTEGSSGAKLGGVDAVTAHGVAADLDGADVAAAGDVSGEGVRTSDER